MADLLGLVDLAMSYLQALIHQLRSDQAAEKRAAARVLGELRCAEAADALCELLLERDGLLQEAAAEALIRIGSPAAEPLCRRLGGQNREVLETIVELGPVVIPHLIRQLRGRAEAAGAAAWALGELAVRRPTPELREALPALRRPRVPRGVPVSHWISIYEVARERIETATADLESYPLPAAAPEIALAELPLPVRPAGAPASLPLPSEAKASSGDRNTL